MEYCSSVWDPPTQHLKDELEAVQRRGARFVMNQPTYRYPKASVSKMIQDLQWDSLQSRRNRSGITMFYKVVNNLVAIPSSYHPPQSTVTSTRGTHPMKLLPIQTSATQYHHSFFPETDTTLEQPSYLGCIVTRLGHLQVEDPASPDVDAFAPLVHMYIR